MGLSAELRLLSTVGLLHSTLEALEQIWIHAKEALRMRPQISPKLLDEAGAVLGHTDLLSSRTFWSRGASPLPFVGL